MMSSETCMGETKTKTVLSVHILFWAGENPQEGGYYTDPGQKENICSKKYFSCLKDSNVINWIDCLRNFNTNRTLLNNKIWRTNVQSVAITIDTYESCNLKLGNCWVPPECEASNILLPSDVAWPCKIIYEELQCMLSVWIKSHAKQNYNTGHSYLYTLAWAPLAYIDLYVHTHIYT